MTHRPLALIAAAGLCLTAVQHAHADSTFNFAQVNAFAPNSTTTPTGTLDGVGFTISFAGSTGSSGLNMTTVGTNGVPYDERSENGQVGVGFSGYSSFTIEFDSAVEDLALYLSFWGGLTSGAHFVDFGRSDFTVNANASGMVAGQTPDTRIATQDNFAQGYVSFTDPVQSLTVSMLDSSGQAFAPPNGHGFTFSGNAAASNGGAPVPGVGGLAAIGLAGISRRRRR